MTFLEELKKRQVFKVGAAYAIVAWLLVQAADVFVPALHLPDWAITLVAGLVLLGFPVALLLAWAYEVTPGGIVPNSEAQAARSVAQPAGQSFNYIIMGVVVLAVLFLLVDRYWLNLRPVDPSASRGPAIERPPIIAAAVMLPPEAPLGHGTAAIGFDSPSVALSPDSRWLVYVSTGPDGSRLFRHRLDGFAPPEEIPDTKGAIFPFFSPDGKHIGFLTDERIKRVSVDGDDVRTIASLSTPVRAQWLDASTIYVIHDQGNSLQRVDVKTGEAQSLVTSSIVFLSSVLPGGAYALGSLRNTSISVDYAEIQLVDTSTGEAEPLGAFGFDARWLPTGHVVFARNGDLYAAPFDMDSGTFTGEPQRVLENVAMDSIFAQVQLALSTDGTLAFVPGSDRAIGQIVAVDAAGVERVLPPAPQRFSVLDLNADDSSMALQVPDVKDYVWIYDLREGTGRKLPSGVGFGWPKYAPDGSLAITHVTSARVDTVVQIVPPDNREPWVLLDSPDLDGTISDWSADSDVLAMSDWQTNEILLIPLAAPEQANVLDAEALEWGAVFSPDGQWMAYSSEDTGRYEIWVRPLAEPDQKRQVSVNGGIEGVWCPCGRIYYRRGNQFWSAAVQTEPELVVGPEELSFTVVDFLDTPGRSYDVSSDGQTLYTLKRSEPAIEDRVHVLSNWLHGMEQRVD
jgi:Tol biopolymer transport system component